MRIEGLLCPDVIGSISFMQTIVKCCHLPCHASYRSIQALVGTNAILFAHPVFAGRLYFAFCNKYFSSCQYQQQHWGGQQPDSIFSGDWNPHPLPPIYAP